MFKHKLNAFWGVREYFCGERKIEHVGLNKNLFRKALLAKDLTIFAIFHIQY